jgi:hypothetical protein
VIKFSNSKDFYVQRNKYHPWSMQLVILLLVLLCCCFASPEEVFGLFSIIIRGVEWGETESAWHAGH